MSDAAVIGPLRRPTWPTSSVGSQCSASASAARLAPGPASITSSAPPGMTSSAGWKTSRTRPGSPSRRRELRQRQTGAEHDRGVHVVTAGVADAGIARAVGHVLRVLERQRVEVGPQQHGRAGGLGVADVAPQAGRRQQLRGRPACVSRLGDDGRGALLAAAELGMARAGPGAARSAPAPVRARKPPAGSSVTTSHRACGDGRAGARSASRRAGCRRRRAGRRRCRRRPRAAARSSRRRRGSASTSASSSAQPSRCGERAQVVDQLRDRLAQRAGGAVLVDDQLGVEPVPGRAPLVLPHHPALRTRQPVAAVELGVELVHQALRERRHRADLVQGRQAVADPQLDGAEAGMRPDVPPDLADRLDGARS